MGYTANSLDVAFTIPADKVPAALLATNAEEDFGGPFPTLTKAVEETTCFYDSFEDETGFHLGYHYDKWCFYTENLLVVLAPYAEEGSFVRMIGEDECLFGFRVEAGKLVEESGHIVWTTWPERQAAQGQEK